MATRLKTGGRAKKIASVTPRKAQKGVRVRAKAPARTAKIRAPPAKLHKPVNRNEKLIANRHFCGLLTELAGEKALKVVGELTVPMTDEDLAEAAKLRISEVRAVMNKLHSARVAAYSRTRSDDGWYTYTWDLCPDNAHKLLEERASEKCEEKTVAGEHYSCPNCFDHTSKTYGFADASETEFRCPDCSEMLKYVEKKK